MATILANTQSLATNLNIDPYYDDFNEGKNFHRLLFRPGFAVQARELTQLQTILQNQIDRFGEHIFKEGSVVRGCELVYESDISYVKLRDNDSTGTSVDVSVFKGSTLTGQTSGVTAHVIDSLTGAEASDPDTKTLYIKYTSAGSNNSTRTFLSAEKLVSNTISPAAATANVVTGTATVVANTGLRVTYDEGIIFAKDHFIRVDKQSLIVGRYSANTTIKIGYDIIEEIVQSGGEATLLDPAQGSYNYAAPGADRLKLTANLVSRSVTSQEDTKFIELLRIKNGAPEFKSDKPAYAKINDYIARRTYDESGDYIVNGLEISIREHLDNESNQGLKTLANGGNTNCLAVDVSPGKAYVKGFEIDTIHSRNIKIEKGNDAHVIEDYSIAANYGNYVAATEVCGNWDINGQDEVKLYDTAQRAVSNNTLGATGPVGTQIGTARVRAVEHSSGDKGAPSCIFNMYLYDIKMTANTFQDVKAIYFNDGTSKAHADLTQTSGATTLTDTGFNKAVFPLTNPFTKRIRNSSGTVVADYKFMKVFDVTIAADGTFTLATGASSEQYPFSSGALNSTQKKANMHVVLNASANGSSTLTGTLSTTATSPTVTGSGTAFDTQLNKGDTIKIINYANVVTVNSIASATSLTLTENHNVTGSSLTATKALINGQMLNMSGVGRDGSRTITIDSTTSASFDIQETLGGTCAAQVFCELNKIDGQEAAKAINKNRYVEINISDAHASAALGNTVGPWPLGLSDGHKITEVRLSTGNAFFSSTSGGTDVTSHFELDDGQRDNYYDHCKLRKKSSSSHSVANGNVYLVKLDYFTHDTSQGVGYFSVDSYPIDDVNSANTTAIQTQDIPIYKSPQTGNELDLRGSLDLRPRITDTANSVTSLTNISRNPAVSVALVEPSGGLHFMPPNESLTSDIEFYMGRVDRVVCTDEGQFEVVKGTPDFIRPMEPPPRGDAMTIGLLNIPPYPSLPKINAIDLGRPEIGVRVKPERIMRYTMRDIGVLKDRIDNLEYYTSLSLLEQSAEQLVLSDASGNNRFKNGILVDNFVGHAVGDVKDNDYTIAMDIENRELRPSFRLNDVQMQMNSANSSNVVKAAKDVRLTLGSSSAAFSNGETVTSGSATGKVTYQVGTFLYVEQVGSTAFSAGGANAVGGSSTATSTYTAAVTPTDGKLVTLPYTHDLTHEQPFATNVRNASGSAFAWVGDIVLTPDTDYWVDTVTKPQVNVELDMNTQAWEQLANAWGTQWGSWKTIPGSQTRRRVVNSGFYWQNYGQSYSYAKVTSSKRETRSGTQLQVGKPFSKEVDLGESVRDTSLTPFMRSRVIQVTATGLKPSAKFFAFFDGEDINEFMTPCNSSFSNTASEGTTLISDSGGVIFATFRLPNSAKRKFRVGSKAFKLTDSITNGEESLTSWAETQYHAQGMNQVKQGTVLSTRNVNLKVNSVTETKTTSETKTYGRGYGWGYGYGYGGYGYGWGGWWGHCHFDPIAQSFYIDNMEAGKDAPGSTGVYLTKIDLFFQGKDSSVGTAVEIREVDPASGLVTANQVPFGRMVLESADINTSDDGTKPTPAVFETPVYLKSGMEYAFVVKPTNGNPNTILWTAKLGQTDKITGNRVVVQPHNGNLFISSNDKVWSPAQEEDLKFRIHYANFGTVQSGSVILKNVDKEYFQCDEESGTAMSVMGETVHGETTFVLGGSTSANVGLSVLGGSSGANGEVTFSSGTSMRVKGVTTTKFTDGETITVMLAGGGPSGTTATISSQSTPTGKVYMYDATTQSNTFIHLSEPSGTFAANTYIKGQINSGTARIISLDSLVMDTFNTQLSNMILQDTTSTFTGKFATSTSARDSAYVNVADGEDSTFDARRFVLGKTTETSGLGGQKSAEVKVTIQNANNKRHSPAIDNDRAALLCVENLINNDTTNEDGASGGNSLARYITRKVELADGQDAEDLKVFITAFKPATSGVKVYYKILNNEDNDLIEQRSWVAMTQVTSASEVSDAKNESDLREFEFTIPTANKTGSSDQVQYTNTSGITFTGYKFYQIKIVLTSTTPAVIPRVKDLRAIALQI